MKQARKTVFSVIFAITALGLPLQPMTIAAATQSGQIDQQALFQQILQFTQGPSHHSLAKAAVGKMSCFDQKDTIIGGNERQELQLDALTHALDKTDTTLGSAVFRQSFLQPTADLSQITKRQEWLKAVHGDEQLYTSIKRSLQRIKKSEHALLAYWDSSQRENNTKLFARAEGFYYTLLQQMLGNKNVNENKLMLDSSMFVKMGITGFNLLFYLGLQGLAHDLFGWIAIGMGNRGNPDDGIFSPRIALMRGLKMPFNVINPFETEYGRAHRGVRLAQGGDGQETEMQVFRRDKEGKDILEGRTPTTFSNCLMHGSARDLWIALTSNYNGKYGIDLSVCGGKGSMPGRLIKRTVNCLGFECAKIDENGTWQSANVPYDKKLPWGGNIRRYGGGMLGWAAITYYRLVMLKDAAMSAFAQAKHIITTMKELHIHTIHLARVIKAAKALVKKLQNHPVLGSSCMVEHMNKVMNNASQDLKDLFTVLEKNTFLTRSAKTQIFSRGNVLYAHRMMGKVRDELVPLLQGIGELDALCSLVHIMKEATPEAPFTFAEFVPNTHAMIEIKDGWLPLVRKAVANTITFGADNSNKIIITGPNGGGKSVFLKMLGVATVMAQTWGVVPAASVRMTLFNGLRTCVHPEESLEHELSTFMAEKMRVDHIKQFVFGHKDPTFKVMLLLDEPFRGTVDAESADRIYSFGKDIAPLQQSIVVIATHVQKPISLTKDTDGVFANYHVQIKELPGGRFEREFILKPGILEWWFADAAKRTRFIDFITMEKHKEQIAQMIVEKKNSAAA